jgi:hypothetical protein
VAIGNADDSSKRVWLKNTAFSAMPEATGREQHWFLFLPGNWLGNFEEEPVSPLQQHFPWTALQQQVFWLSLQFNAEIAAV